MRVFSSTNTPMDFCLDCAPSEEEAIELYGNVGDGPDRRESCFAYDAEHPPYSDFVFGGPYRCCSCGRKLTEED